MSGPVIVPPDWSCTVPEAMVNAGALPLKRALPPAGAIRIAPAPAIPPPLLKVAPVNVRIPPSMSSVPMLSKVVTSSFTSPLSTTRLRTMNEPSFHMPVPERCCVPVAPLTKPPPSISPSLLTSPVAVSDRMVRVLLRVIVRAVQSRLRPNAMNPLLTTSPLAEIPPGNWMIPAKVTVCDGRKFPRFRQERSGEL